jgi:hypothetical protein
MMIAYTHFPLGYFQKTFHDKNKFIMLIDVQLDELAYTLFYFITFKNNLNFETNMVPTHLSHKWKLV